MDQSGDSSMSDWGDSGVTAEDNVDNSGLLALGGGSSLVGRPNMDAGMDASGLGWSMSGTGNPVAPESNSGGVGGGMMGGSIMGGGWIGAGGGLIGLNESDDRPMLPMHSAEEIKEGSKVWLCAAEDFSTLMKAEMSAEIVPLTHGNAVGIVKRHSENTTFVQFEAQPNSDVVMGFSLARQGLSLEKIDAKKPTFVFKEKFGVDDFGGVGDLGPKAGRQNPNAKSDGTEAFTIIDHYVVQVGSDHTDPLAGSPRNVSHIAGGAVAAAKKKESTAIALYKMRHYKECLDKLSLSIQGHAERHESEATGTSSVSPAHSQRSGQGERSPGSGSVNWAAGGDETDEFGMSEKEALIWRSACRLKLGQLEGALEDALKCIETDADWGPGYVRSAEVYVAQGKHASAKGLLDQAAFLHEGQNTTGLAPLVELYEALNRADGALGKKGFTLKVDSETIRRLVTKRRFEKGDVMLSEQPSCWVATMANEADLCVHCGAFIAKGTGIAAPSPKLCDMKACSLSCAKEAKRRYRDYESTLGAKATYAANFVIRDRANSVTNVAQLEVAQLAMRAFHCLVVASQERIGVTVDPVTRVQTGRFPAPTFSVTPELTQLGLLPTPNPETPLDPKTKGDVGTLWGILTAQFSASEKEAYPVKLFNAIYAGVAQYAVRQEVRCTGADKKLKSQLLLFPNIGCADLTGKSKGMMKMVEVATLEDASNRSNGGVCDWELVATATVEPQTQI